MNYLKAIIALVIIRLLILFFSEEEIVGIMGQFMGLDDDKGLLIFSDAEGNVKYADVVDVRELLG